jgi:tryptophan 2,3-dioxygenase
MAHETTVPPADGARLDFSRAMSYGDYLHLDRLLAVQHPRSHDHNEIEFLLGNKDAVKMEPHRHRPELFGELERLLREPSLYDEAIRLLARRGFTIDGECVERDCASSHAFNESVCRAWVEVYRSTASNWDLYELAEKLVDLEDAFRQWRFRHATTVERVIGFKRGSGGTSGVNYLRQVLDVVLFPELWRARTAL